MFSIAPSVGDIVHTEWIIGVSSLFIQSVLFNVVLAVNNALAVAFSPGLDVSHTSRPNPKWTPRVEQYGNSYLRLSGVGYLRGRHAVPGESRGMQYFL